MGDTRLSGDHELERRSVGRLDGPCDHIMLMVIMVAGSGFPDWLKRLKRHFMLRWFEHVGRMDERILTKHVQKASVNEPVERGRPPLTYSNLI